MSGDIFDAFTRRAANLVSRRKSLVTLGAAALGATVAAPSIAEAGKAGKKAKKKCKKQKGKCESEVELFCGDNKGTEECLQDLLPCCQPLAKCNAGLSTECLLESFLIKK